MNPSAALAVSCKDGNDTHLFLNSSDTEVSVFKGSLWRSVQDNLAPPQLSTRLTHKQTETYELYDLDSLQQSPVRADIKRVAHCLL